MLISFSKAIVSDSPLHRNLHSQSLDSAFDETENENHFGANLIPFEIGKSSIPADRSFRIENSLILSLSLSLVLGFSGKQTVHMQS